MAKLVIWASGKARPMASASTTGRPVIAATSSGWKALPPPISTDMTAVNRRPRYSSIIRTGLAANGGIGQPFLTDQRRTHVGDDGDQGVIGEIGGVHQVDPHAVGIEFAHVEVGKVRRPAPPGSKDPGTGRQWLQFVRLDLPHPTGPEPIAGRDVIGGYGGEP